MKVAVKPLPGGEVMKHFRRELSTLILVAAVSCSMLAGGVFADAGDIDPTFDGDGKVSTDFSNNESANDVVVQPDGKIVAAGITSVDAVNSDFALARYGADGALDPSFGTGGKVTTDFFGLFDRADAMALQPDGKIVVAGLTGDRVSQGDFALARYNSDGTLDASFGTGGKVVTDFSGGLDGASGVALQPDGRVVAVGTSAARGQFDFALARYNGDGSLDPSFGTGGKVTNDFSPIDTASAVAIQPDGRIVVSGSTFSIPTVSDFAVARYETDGSLDASFGTGGRVKTDFFGASDLPAALALQADGRIVVAGAVDDLDGSAFDFGLVRYNFDGTVDLAFGSNGKVTTDFAGGLDGARDVALQADGRIILAGTAGDGLIRSATDFALARYELNGRLDSTFGSGGKVMTDVSAGFDTASALAIQQDGRLVLAGGTGSGESSVDFALVRYSATGGPDFSIALNPQSATVARGQKIAVRVNLNRIEGFTGGVTVSAPDADAMEIRLNQETLPIEGTTVKFKVKIKGSAPTGRHQLVFVATSASGQQRSSALTLDIQ
jgi:uncharacterized delta-60 repeat protein